MAQPRLPTQQMSLPRCAQHRSDVSRADINSIHAISLLLYPLTLSPPLIPQTGEVNAASMHTPSPRRLHCRLHFYNSLCVCPLDQIHCGDTRQLRQRLQVSLQETHVVCLPPLRCPAFHAISTCLTLDADALSPRRW